MKGIGEFIERNAVDIVLVGLLLVGLGAGGFGAGNWNLHLSPDPPVKNFRDTDQTYALRVEQYHRAVERVGHGATVPLPLAVGLTFVGFGLVVVCGLMLLDRNWVR